MICHNNKVLILAYMKPRKSWNDESWRNKNNSAHISVFVNPNAKCAILKFLQQILNVLQLGALWYLRSMRPTTTAEHELSTQRTGPSCKILHYLSLLGLIEVLTRRNKSTMDRTAYFWKKNSTMGVSLFNLTAITCFCVLHTPRQCHWRDWQRILNKFQSLKKNSTLQRWRFT